jgi:predicted GTPase
MHSSAQYLTMIPCGAPGAGKSHVANFMIDGYNSGRSRSDQSTVSGLTQDVSSHKGCAFGKLENVPLLIFDNPGFGDGKIDISAVATKISSKCSSEKFDACLLVLKSLDYRISFQEVCALRSMRWFFDGFTAKRFFAVFTHCDIQMPDEDWI